LRYLFARHGESEFSVRGLLNGDTTVPGGLTSAGVAQARRLGAALAEEPLALCVTSELQRTRETADLALDGRDVPRLVLPGLNDPLYGRFEGRSLAEYRAWAASVPSSALPGRGGESRRAIVDRYVGAFRRLLERHETTVLVVAHSLPIAYLVAARRGMAPERRMPLVPYARPDPFERAELERASSVLEQWLAEPTW